MPVVVPFTPGVCPANWGTGHVHGQYIDTFCNPIAGYLTFQMDVDRLIDADDLLIIIPKVRQVTIDQSGTIDVDLPATDDPQIAPTGFHWLVVEHFPGGKSYTISLPVDGNVELSEVAA